MLEHHLGPLDPTRTLLGLRPAGSLDQVRSNESVGMGSSQAGTLPAEEAGGEWQDRRSHALIFGHDSSERVRGPALLHAMLAGKQAFVITGQSECGPAEATLRPLASSGRMVAVVALAGGSAHWQAALDSDPRLLLLEVDPLAHHQLGSSDHEDNAYELAATLLRQLEPGGQEPRQEHVLALGQLASRCASLEELSAKLEAEIAGIPTLDLSESTSSLRMVSAILSALLCGSADISRRRRIERLSEADLAWASQPVTNRRAIQLQMKEAAGRCAQATLAMGLLQKIKAETRGDALPRPAELHYAVDWNWPGVQAAHALLRHQGCTCVASASSGSQGRKIYGELAWRSFNQNNFDQVMHLSEHGRPADLEELAEQLTPLRPSPEQLAGEALISQLAETGAGQGAMLQIGCRPRSVSLPRLREPQMDLPWWAAAPMIEAPEKRGVPNPLFAPWAELELAH